MNYRDFRKQGLTPMEAREEALKKPSPSPVEKKKKGWMKDYDQKTSPLRLKNMRG